MHQNQRDVRQAAADYAAIAAQKNFNAIYLMGIYSDAERPRRFKEGFAKAGKKLDIGKSCVRFRTLDDLPLDVIAETIADLPMNDYIALYERSRLQSKESQRRAAKNVAKKPGARTARTSGRAPPMQPP